MRTAPTGKRRLRLAAVVSLAMALALMVGLLLADEQDSPAFMAAKGRVTFRTYCASCHGVEALGNGNVARFLTVQPADLTRISERYGGEFPADRIREIIDGRVEVRTHGSKEMPIWGDVFQDPLSLEGATDEDMEQRAQRMVDELVLYLETIQVTGEQH